jgi:hypothetical protein
MAFVDLLRGFNNDCSSREYPGGLEFILVQFITVVASYTARKTPLSLLHATCDLGVLLEIPSASAMPSPLCGLVTRLNLPPSVSLSAQ